MNDALIIDLDGTLCDSEHRLKYVLSTHKDWDKFYSLMRDDAPNSWCCSIIDKFRHHAQIIYITGRPEKYFTTTFGWLQEYGLPSDCIFMRKDNDYRQDYIIKEELYLKHIKDKYNVLFCIDDRSTVADMWRRNGLVCLQCQPGE